MVRRVVELDPTFARLFEIQSTQLDFRPEISAVDRQAICKLVAENFKIPLMSLERLPI
jgi:hypothetical protein